MRVCFYMCERCFDMIHVVWLRAFFVDGLGARRVLGRRGGASGMASTEFSEQAWGRFPSSPFSVLVWARSRPSNLIDYINLHQQDINTPRFAALNMNTHSSLNYESFKKDSQQQCCSVYWRLTTTETRLLYRPAACRRRLTKWECNGKNDEERKENLPICCPHDTVG